MLGGVTIFTHFVQQSLSSGTTSYFGSFYNRHTTPKTYEYMHSNILLVESLFQIILIIHQYIYILN